MKVKFYVVFLCFAYASAVNAAEVVTFDEGVQLYNAKKYVDALIVFTSLEARGEIRAAYALGWMYENGQGSEANIQKASNYYMKAAKQGHSDAQNKLGIMLLTGNGGKKNFEQAYQLFEQSAAQNNKYGAWNAARFVLEADASHFTENLLKKALVYAERAKSLGHKEAGSLIGTLQCILNDNASVKNDVFTRESLAHYEVKGNVRVLEHDKDIYYFGKAGHLVRAVFGYTNIEHRYTYDKNGDLLKWEAIKYSDDASGNYKVVGVEEFTYLQGKISSYTTPFFGCRDIKYYYYPQSDGGLFEVQKEIGSEYPVNTYKKYNSAGLLEWSNGGVPVRPSEFWVIIPGDGPLYSRVFNEGTSRMRFQGGEQYLFTSGGALRKIIDNNAPDGSYQSSVEYSYGSDGWIREEIFHGTSNRNSPIKHVKYSNYKLDNHGNWESREQSFMHNDFQRSNLQRRIISYY